MITKVTRSKPSIQLVLDHPNFDIVSAYVTLDRVGENIPFAEYINTGMTITDERAVINFTFDELLFTRGFGRYRMRLYFNGAIYSVTYIQVENEETVSIKAV